jgi:hypothetical protein
VWPEEELEDLVCDVTCDVMILGVCNLVRFL